VESSEQTPTYGVAELLSRADQALTREFPGPIWVRGEVSGMRRTTRGAVFFRLVDPDSPDSSLEVAVRGRVMREVDMTLERAGVGSLNNGVEVRASGTLGISTRSQFVLSMLEVDPSFTVGRLAVDREEVLRRLVADGSVRANKALPIPLVPLRIGLVTSRGTAAHADFLDQLRASGFRFRVLTAHASMQGERAPEEITSALARLSGERVDAVALVRGGGAKLDLRAFDTEEVARAVARMPVPVVSGIGHEIDRSVADEVSAISVKTPTAAAEWLVSRVADYATRLDRARAEIRDRARDAHRRTATRLGDMAGAIGSARHAVDRQSERLTAVAERIADRARHLLQTRERELESLSETLSAVGIEPTLRRGFTLVSRLDGSPVLRGGDVEKGETLRVRFADVTVRMVVEEPE
jgi:exodeoxyribonuclease VII large subunit